MSEPPLLCGGQRDGRRNDGRCAWVAYLLRTFFSVPLTLLWRSSMLSMNVRMNVCTRSPRARDAMSRVWSGRDEAERLGFWTIFE